MCLFFLSACHADRVTRRVSNVEVVLYIIVGTQVNRGKDELIRILLKSDLDFALIFTPTPGDSRVNSVYRFLAQ
jgi:hypothetical protein